MVEGENNGKLLSKVLQVLVSFFIGSLSLPFSLSLSLFCISEEERDGYELHIRSKRRI